MDEGKAADVDVDLVLEDEDMHFFEEESETTKDCDDDIQIIEQQLNGKLLRCQVCPAICYDIILMDCCAAQACQRCATKKITDEKKCWDCGRSATLKNMIANQKFRHMVNDFKSGISIKATDYRTMKDTLVHDSHGQEKKDNIKDTKSSDKNRSDRGQSDRVDGSTARKEDKGERSKKKGSSSDKSKMTKVYCAAEYLVLNGKEYLRQIGCCSQSKRMLHIPMTPTQDMTKMGMDYLLSAKICHVKYQDGDYPIGATFQREDGETADCLNRKQAAEKLHRYLKERKHSDDQLVLVFYSLLEHRGVYQALKVFPNFSKLKVIVYEDYCYQNNIEFRSLQNTQSKYSADLLAAQLRNMFDAAVDQKKLELKNFDDIVGFRKFPKHSMIFTCKRLAPKSMLELDYSVREEKLEITIDGNDDPGRKSREVTITKEKTSISIPRESLAKSRNDTSSKPRENHTADDSIGKSRKSRWDSNDKATNDIDELAKTVNTMVLGNWEMPVLVRVTNVKDTTTAIRYRCKPEFGKGEGEAKLFRHKSNFYAFINVQPLADGRKAALRPRVINIKPRDLKVIEPFSGIAQLRMLDNLHSSPVTEMSRFEVVLDGPNNVELKYNSLISVLVSLRIPEHQSLKLTGTENFAFMSPNPDIVILTEFFTLMRSGKETYARILVRGTSASPQMLLSGQSLGEAALITDDIFNFVHSRSEGQGVMLRKLAAKKFSPDPPPKDRQEDRDQGLVKPQIDLSWLSEPAAPSLPTLANFQPEFEPVFGRKLSGDNYSGPVRSVQTDFRQSQNFPDRSLEMRQNSGWNQEIRQQLPAAAEWSDQGAAPFSNRDNSSGIPSRDEPRWENNTRTAMLPMERQDIHQMETPWLSNPAQYLQEMEKKFYNLVDTNRRRIGRDPAGRERCNQLETLFFQTVDELNMLMKDSSFHMPHVQQRTKVIFESMAKMIRDVENGLKGETAQPATRNEQFAMNAELNTVHRDRYQAEMDKQSFSKYEEEIATYEEKLARLVDRRDRKFNTGDINAQSSTGFPDFEPPWKQSRRSDEFGQGQRDKEEEDVLRRRDQDHDQFGHADRSSGGQFNPIDGHDRKFDNVEQFRLRSADEARRRDDDNGDSRRRYFRRDSSDNSLDDERRQRRQSLEYFDARYRLEENDGGVVGRATDFDQYVPKLDRKPTRKRSRWDAAEIETAWSVPKPDDRRGSSLDDRSRGFGSRPSPWAATAEQQENPRASNDRGLGNMMPGIPAVLAQAAGSMFIPDQSLIFWGQK